MTELPEPTGVVVGEERGYSDWFHVINWTYNYHMPKGTKFYTEQQMRDYGRAEYLRAIDDAAKVCDVLEEREMGAWAVECAAAIRALAGENT